MSRSTKRQWWIVSGLLFLALVPVVAGAGRMSEVASGGPIGPENARFVANPVSAILHIASATVFAVLGAFQFAPSLRRGRSNWHRKVGPLLMASGMTVAISGLWMNQVYDLPPNDRFLVYFLRIVFGAGMAASIALSALAIRRRDFASHGAWMMRAYAIGMGAGTQVFTHLPYFLLSGQAQQMPSEVPRAIMMGAAWVLNLAVVEFVLARKRSAGTYGAPVVRRIEVAAASTGSP